MRTPRKKRPRKKQTAGSRAKKTAVSGSGKKRSSAPRWIGKIADVTRELNLSQRRIYQLANEGLPKIAPGHYDIVACARWYIRFMQQKLLERAVQRDGAADGSTESAGVVRHTILSIEAELKQIELAEKREQLISRGRVERDTAKIVAEIRTRILAVSRKIAVEVLGETDLAISQVKIDRALKRALEELSEFDPDDAVTPASSARSSTQ